MASRYIVGSEGKLVVVERTPHVFTNGGKRFAQFLAPTGPGMSQSLCTVGCFEVTRGVVREVRSLYDQKRVYARVLSEDIAAELAEVDAAIARQREALRKVEEERQQLLAAVVVQSALVRIPKGGA